MKKPKTILDDILEDPNDPRPLRELENPAHRRNWYGYPPAIKLQLLADAMMLIAQGFKRLAKTPTAPKKGKR